MSSSPLVRREEPEDYDTIDAVLRDAFGAGGEAVVALVERISASPLYVPELALVAEHDSEVIGHTMLSWVGLRSPARDRLLILTPIAVRSDRQRRGVGRR